MSEEERKPTCFIIQAFDGGKYDLRYQETIRPALIKAEVEPQRGDEILGLNPIIDKVEKAIESASICIAEVSEDNPNVWLELGYALALGRPTVILCDRSVRQRLPFDVQHRPVIFYRTDSRSGYDELEANIVKWVKNELAVVSRLNRTKTLKLEGQMATDLEDYEVAVLSAAFAFWTSSDGGISQGRLEQNMKDLQFSEVALALGVTSLIERDFISEQLLVEEHFNNISEEYKCYSVTKAGVQWLQENKSLLQVKLPLEPEQIAAVNNSQEDEDFDDDIPF